VGKKTVLELHRVGFYTISQLRQQTLASLIAHFGENFGTHLFNLSLGKDDRELATETDEKSISHEQTFESDTGDTEQLLTTLLDLSERVARRARKDGLTGLTITFVWRNPDFSRQSHGRTLPTPTCSSQEIFSVARDLFLETIKIQTGYRGREFRLVGVRLSHFSELSQQTSLFESPKSSGNLDSAMDAVRNKFGEGAIARARLTDRDSEEK
jgi:DNA polymerase-4